MSGKPGNVREFETCQGNVRDNVNSQGIVREESGKNYCQGKLSQNCSLLVEYLRNAGMDIKNVDITPQMVAAVRQSSAAYKAALAAKQTDRVGEEQNLREKRKRKDLISRLEQQKRLKLDELKSQAQELDKQIADLKASK